MLVIDFYGGPGAGKSTLAAGLFAKMKQGGFAVEYVPEYAKDLVWEGRSLANQVQILGKQFHRLWRLKDHVGYVVTDSPIMLCGYYNAISSSQDYLRTLSPLVGELHHKFLHVGFWVDRMKPYQQYGRVQDETEARRMDDTIRNYLETWRLPLTRIPGDESGIDIAYRALDNSAL